MGLAYFCPTAISVLKRFQGSLGGASSGLGRPAAIGAAGLGEPGGGGDFGLLQALTS